MSTILTEYFISVALYSIPVMFFMKYTCQNAWKDHQQENEQKNIFFCPTENLPIYIYIYIERERPKVLDVMELKP